MFIWLKDYIAQGKLTLDEVNQFVNFNVALIIINQAIGLLGYGYAAYGQGTDWAVGTTGYSFSGNEYGVLVCLFFSLKLYLLKEQKVSGLKYLMYFLLFQVITITIASKSVMLGTFLSGVFIGISFKFTRALRLGLISLLCIVFSLPYLELDFSGIAAFQRITYSYQTRELVGALYSGRDDMLRGCFDLFREGYSGFENLVGIGPSRLAYLGKSPEMDPFDVLFFYGIIGAFVVYLPFLLLCLKNIFRRKRDMIDQYVSFMAILIFFISFFAGHVLFSVAVAPIFSIIFSMHEIRTK